MSLAFSVAEAQYIATTIFSLVEFVWAMLGAGYIMRMLKDMVSDIRRRTA